MKLESRTGRGGFINSDPGWDEDWNDAAEQILANAPPGSLLTCQHPDGWYIQWRIE